MTRNEFETWVEKHYNELLAVARRRVREDAEDVVQDAIVGMQKSPELLSRSETTIWPWAVQVVRYAARNDRVSAERAERSLQDAALLLSDEQNRNDGRYLGSVGFGAYPVGLSFCNCTGHLQWRGEKVHQPGCSTTQTLWIEAGYDRLPTSGRHVSYVYGSLACLNGSRAYINLAEIAALPLREPAHTSGFDDQELLRDATRSRPSHCYEVSVFEKKTNTDNSPRPSPEGEGKRLVCDECDEMNPALWSCEHATAKEVTA